MLLYIKCYLLCIKRKNKKSKKKTKNTKKYKKKKNLKKVCCKFLKCAKKTHFKNLQQTIKKKKKN